MDKSLAVEGVSQGLADILQLLDGDAVRLFRGAWPCMRGQVFPVQPAAGEQLLDAANGIAVLIEEAVDAVREGDVRRPVVAAVAGALQRTELRKARFPVSQDVLRDPEIFRQFADGAESLVAFAGLRQCVSP